jgi:hypothetical protein
VRSCSKGHGMDDWAEFHHFRYLLAILEKRGLRAASEELPTSPPNLTVQARQFQKHAGVRLFRRSKAGTFDRPNLLCRCLFATYASQFSVRWTITY